MFKVKATRTERIVSLSGHCFPVEAGQIYELPDVVMTEAFAAGCIPLELPDAPAAEDAPASAQARADAVYNAVAEILAKSDGRLLGPEGYPKVAQVKRITGFEPTIEEIVVAADSMKDEG